MTEKTRPDDKEIISGLQRGDQRSGTDLILRYQKELLAYLEFGMHVPKSNAEEIMNDKFYEIIRNPGFIKPGVTSLRPLLYKSCQNAARDWHRKETRQEKAFANVAQELVAEDELRKQAAIHHLEFDASNSELDIEKDLLMQSLSGLDQMYRDTLTLKASGMSYQDIAESLKEKEGTIRQRHKRGLEYLTERFLFLLDNQSSQIRAKIRKKYNISNEGNS
jgi:RNA polymerase sigma factor (sigma-70 family)